MSVKLARPRRSPPLRRGRPDSLGRTRLNYLRMAIWAEGDARGRRIGPRHVGDGIQGELPDRPLLRARRLRRRRRRRVQGGGRGRHVGEADPEGATSTASCRIYSAGALARARRAGRGLRAGPFSRQRCDSTSRRGPAGRRRDRLLQRSRTQPWVMRHACDLRIAGEEGVLVLDFERVRAEVACRVTGSGEVLHVGVEPAVPPTPRGSTRATGLRSPRRHCLGRKNVRPLPQTWACAPSP